jgi:hypothetical protein
MKLEKVILISVWLITIGLLFLIPKAKKRLAIVAFLFKELITWPTGLLVVQYGLITYPIRLFFAETNRASFTYEFFVYPVMCSLFNVFYPNDRSKLYQFFYYCAYCTGLTIPESLLERYTHLIHYIHWSWFWTWITLLLTFAATRFFCVWFFKGLSKEIH